jgi:hypothetical protein
MTIPSLRMRPCEYCGTMINEDREEDCSVAEVGI